MKKIKYIFLSLAFSIICFILFGFLKPTNFSQVSNAAPIGGNPLNYVTVVCNGQVYNSSNSTTIDSVTRSVMINGPVTINLNPFKVRFSNFSEDNDEYFTKNYQNFKVKIPIDKKQTMQFDYNGTTFYCLKQHTGESESSQYYKFQNKLESPTISVQTLNNILFDCKEEDNYLYIKILDSYTLKSSDLKSIDFTFKPQGTDSELTIRFLKPIVNFANAKTKFLKFETFKDFNSETNEYDYYELDSLLQSEQVFNKLKLTFLNDEYTYTEDNSLFFNINFNGFVYNFKLYTKIVKLENIKYKNPEDEDPGELCLFVEYTDKVSNNTIQLATDYSQELDYDDNPYINYIEKVLPNEQFSITFNYRGRYAIEFYDKTYDPKNPNTNFKNPNYYQTSFYLKNDASSDNDTESRFKDIYILAESIDGNKKPVEYIVNKSTQNNSVLVLIKNMLLGKNDTLSLSDVVDRIEYTITEFGNTGGNHPITTIYYPETDENKFNTNVHKISELLKLNSDGDYYMYCENDAIYSFEIYAKFQSLDAKNNKYYQKTTYQFTIVKDIKTSFKPDVEDNKVDSTHTQSVPYIIDEIPYTNKINNSDPMRFDVAYNERIPVDELNNSEATKILDITYRNTYKIMYGMQQVNITHVINEDNTAITFIFQGVGNMTVYINRGGEELVYKFQTGVGIEGTHTLTFTEYASYSITLIDSMGTTPGEPYKVNFAKKLNTSALILIILSSIIAASIAAFIILVRGRVKTR